MAEADVGTGHWARLAQRWEASGPPLRVSRQDLDEYGKAFARLIEGRPAPRVLLLGVTPELYRFGWPPGTDLVAVDRSAAMIELVWAGPPEMVRREQWTQLSLPEGSRDLAICDGGLHLLGYPAGQAELVRSLARVVARGGACVFRLFVPAAGEEVDTVLASARAGEARNVNAFKVRLTTALQRDPVAGVEVRAAWRAFVESENDPDGLADRNGWTVDQTATFRAYEESADSYHFVTVEEAERLFCVDPGGFVLDRLRTPDYDMGERFPIVEFRRTDG